MKETFLEIAQTLQAEAEQKAAIQLSEAAQEKREEQIQRIAKLSDVLYSSGSCGLVLIDHFGGSEIKDCLVTRHGKENTLFLSAPGTVQQAAMDEEAATEKLGLLAAFRERTGKDGLIILNRFDFRDPEDGGTPSVRNFLTETVNIANAPMLLAMGPGSTSDVPSNRYNPVKQSGFADHLAGRAALYGGEIKFLIENNPWSRPAVLPKDLPPGDIVDKTFLEPPQGHTRL